MEIPGQINLFEFLAENCIDYYTNYMIQQFERISRELSEQIGLDKEKMYKRCRKKIENEKDGVGEEAMILAFHKKN